MCGISIIISKKGQSIPKNIIESMTDKIIHRGPDAAGYHFGKNFAFGHRRLKIIDLSDAASQPMNFQNLTIIYNGEVYNYIEIREELKILGYSFQSESDTEVVIKAFHAWGNNCFNKFNGMWAFTIYDKETDEIVFCRDHFGIKPLNYYISDNYFAVASEIKQFYELPDFKPNLNFDVAIDFLANGLLNINENTFFKGVKELRGGHSLHYSLKTGKYYINNWYNFKKNKKNKKINYEKAKTLVNNLLSDSLKIRCRSDVKLGSCLSGGIDSSAMVCLLHQKQIDGFYPETVTSCFENKKYDEQQYSDLVSKQTGFKAIKVFPNLNELLAGDLEKIIYHQDQPIPSASHFAEFSVFKSAKENNLTVMLDGQGSDEYFAGYGEFFTVFLFELFKSFRFLKMLKIIIKRAKDTNRSIYHIIRNFTSFLFENNIKIFVYKLLCKKYFSEKYFSDSSIKKYRSIISRKQRLYKNIQTLSKEQILKTSIPYQLHSEDRNSMLFSVESRLPYLDINLVEFGLSLPSSFKIKHAVSKAILRDAVPTMPEAIRNRKDKMGFVSPDDIWFLENAETIRKDIQEAIIIFSDLLSEKILDLFDEQIIQKKKYNPFFFRLWSFYIWYKIFFLKNCTKFNSTL